ncbi:MAG: PE domain-containing protein [Mycobacterium sp.]
MVFAMVPAVVEAGLAGESAATATAAAPAVMSPLPMAADVDSARFAAIAAAAGAAHVATAEQHAVMRGLYSGGQSLAMITTVATELMRAAAASI